MGGLGTVRRVLRAEDTANEEGFPQREDSRNGGKPAHFPIPIYLDQGSRPRLVVVRGSVGRPGENQFPFHLLDFRFLPRGGRSVEFPKGRTTTGGDSFRGWDVDRDFLPAKNLFRFGDR